MKSHHLKILSINLLIMLSMRVLAQEIPDDRILGIDQLVEALKPEVRTQLEADREISNAKLAGYFRVKFSERFFYEYQTFYDRWELYQTLYHNREDHKARALDHLGKYPDSTQWVLPFNYLNGQPVNAYALRHLARQHKMVDLALLYFIDGKDPDYIEYFKNQMRSLNAALESGQYEKIEDGNGVYEVFRSGYRILNWLWIHNMFLNEGDYSDDDQLYTIATLLQHGAHLYTRNHRFRSGNHQTRGMSALAMLSILLRDFEGTDKWYERAMLRLSEHLDKEINTDGFQFERSVHYHMSDINNYFCVYQLAKTSKIEVDDAWEGKLRTLFTTLAKIAYPDGSAPVLQDDTEIPWGEKNDISGVMTLGYLLFEDPEFGYFASDKVAERMYWFLTGSQVELLRSIRRKKPSYGSLAFEDTHYYIMREGWDPNHKMMIISAGFDKEKPDHQHGDMLGIQAMANRQVILPNYQVRYSLEDFEFFKNSMVKNVALIDDELQGKQWISNKGGSGFGKFGDLPNPMVIAWESNDSFDLFVGSHDGFANKGVEYTRQVIYVKDDFWIIKDNFRAQDAHNYKQVWQGHYTWESGPHLIRATFTDASGCDILQLKEVDTVFGSGVRGKNWNVISTKSTGDFNYLTVIFPYQGYENRIDNSSKLTKVGDWLVDSSQWQISGTDPVALSKEDESYFFGVQTMKFENLTVEISGQTDLYVKLSDTKLSLLLLGDSKQTVTCYHDQLNRDGRMVNELTPGEKLIIDLPD